MPLGAHESMETHEILMEKINAISHFNLYAEQATNPLLIDMIVRHQQEEIRSYNELVALTRGSNRFAPVTANTTIRRVGRQQIQYGVNANNPPQFEPMGDAVLSDTEIALAMLHCHKNGAKNAMWASLECADSNLRRTLLNCAANCNNQAYEVFLFMNQQGTYPVPTLDRQQEASFLGSYQPAGAQIQNQYAMPGGQMAGAGMVGGAFNTGSPDSVLYGGGLGGAGVPYQTGTNMGTGYLAGQSGARPGTAQS